MLHLIRRETAKHGHGNVIAVTQIALHLILQIFEGVEFQKIIKPLLIISVTSFYLSVVPWRFRANRLAIHVNFIAKHIEGVDSIRFCRVAEFSPVVCLNCFRSISEEGNGPFEKVHTGISALLLVRIDESLTACFLNYGVLEELTCVILFMAIESFRYV